MPFKKFEQNEIFYNTIKTTPNYEFKIYGGKGYLNNSDFYVNLNDLKLGSEYYPFIQKGGQLSTFKTISQDQFSIANYADTLSGSYPYSSSIDLQYYYENSSRRYINSLKNNLNKYTIYSHHYAYSGSFGDKGKQKLNLISIPSILFGSSLEKGSVNLKFYISGTLVGSLEDTKKNGELIETTNSGNLGKVAGVVMYNEGFILLTGSWNLDNSLTENYIYSPSLASDNPKWIYWGSGFGKTSNLPVSSSYSLSFNGINYIQTITMLANAEKNELNYSNNPTYLKFGESEKIQKLHNSNTYIEPDTLDIKNTVKYKYENFSGSLEKQTFISKINIYDEDMKLIGIAKLSKPVKKTQNRNFTFKLKLDI
jgi:hypothetical protein